MGLDVLFDGGRSVRLFIQGCLILWLGCFSSASYGSWVEIGATHRFSKQSWNAQASIDSWIDSYNTYHKNSYPYTYYQLWVDLSRCDGYTICATMSKWGWNDSSSEPTFPSACLNENTSCDGTYPFSEPCEAPNFIDPETNECITPQEPSECYENGQIYDSGRGYCVLDCPNGQLNGVCLEDTADNADTCDSSAPDYKGSIGFGNQKQNICLSDTTCEGGSLGVVNDVQLCVPDEYGPPTCSADAVLVMDEYGWVCESLNDQPEPEPEPPEEPNTDTDGDGVPDEYQRENDPDAVNKGLDGVNQGVGETNKKLDQANDQLDNIRKGLAEIDKALDTGLGSVNDHLKQLNDGMAPPEGGFNPDGFGGMIPTFQETTTGFANSINSIPAVVAVSSVANLPESLTCPVYTIPATPVSGPLVMDIHCGVFNDYSGVISALFLFFWSGTALFVFLRA